MGVEVSFVAAFIAGVLSISSPCVLPLVPIFLAHLAGTSVIGVAVDRRRVLTNAFAYVLGFSLVFVALGVALGAAGALASTASVVASNRDWLTRIGGALLIVLGLHQLGIVRLPLLERERRISASRLPGRAGHLVFLGRRDVRRRLVALRRADPGRHPDHGRRSGQHRSRRVAPRRLFRRAGRAVPRRRLRLWLGAGAVSRVNRRLPLLTGISGGVMVAMGAIMTLGIYQQFFARLVALSPWIPWEPTL